MLKNLKNLGEKLIWAIFNIGPPVAVAYQGVEVGVPRNSRSIIVVAIDYDKFVDRKAKMLGRTAYPCGRQGLDYVLKYCKDRSLEYLNVITTDETAAPRTYDGVVNTTIRVRNGGSDIAALEAISAVLSRYSHVVVINSSANVNDAQKIAVIHRALIDMTCRHFVIGFNGNSRISPRLPLAPSHTPHVITNFFASPVVDILSTLRYARSLDSYRKLKGFSNKYFAIRYFEILLSRNAVFNNGALALLKDNEILYYRCMRDPWPRMDSRLLSR